jgi:hypothetical protein
MYRYTHRKGLKVSSGKAEAVSAIRTDNTMDKRK